MIEGLDLIPEQYRSDLIRYIEDGIVPSPPGFLFAVLTNNLFRTHLIASQINTGPIDDYITFFTEHAPPNCFGSRAKVEAWIEDAAERRTMAIARAQP